MEYTKPSNNTKSQAFAYSVYSDTDVTATKSYIYI